MARSYWKKTLVTSLTWAGLAWAQQPSTVPTDTAAKPAERHLTIQEPGRPSQKCRLVQAFRTSDGMKAYQVQSLETGEMLTVVQSAPQTTGGAVSMKIYHWGSQNTPPAGSPVPPVLAQVSGSVPVVTAPTQHGSPRPATANQTASAPVQAAAGDRIMTVQEPGKPAQQCKVIKTFRTPQGTVAHQVQSLQTGEVMTIEDGAATASSGSSSQPKTLTGRLTQWGQSNSSSTPVAKSSEWSVPASSSTTSPSSPTVAQAYPQTQSGMKTTTISSGSAPATTSTTGTQASQTTTTTVVDESHHGVRQKLHDIFHPTGTQQVASAPSSTTTSTATPAASPTSTADVKQVQQQTVAKPVDSTSSTAKTDTKSSKTEVASTSGSDWRQSWGKADDHKSQTKELPHASTGRPDPLTDPEKFSRRTGEDRQKDTSSGAQDQTADARSAAKDGMSVMKIATGQDKPLSNASGSRVPLGAGSVLAAGAAGPNQVQYVPVPVVTLPDARRPEPPPARLPQPPQPTQTTQTARATTAPANSGFVNAFSTAQPSNTVVQANAFTVAGSATTPAASAARTPVSVPTASYLPGTNNGPIQQMAYNPAMDRHAGTPVRSAALGTPSGTPQNKQQLIGTLKDSLYPSQREWAADSLAQGEGQHDPAAVKALMTAAREDPAPTVRAACVRCLGRIKNSSGGALELVQSLKTDPDPRVREEVERTLKIYATGQTPPIGQTIQPVGFVVPGK